MPAELTSESTHEDIQNYVDQIVEDRKGEQSAQPEEKGDAQKIAEERDKPVGDTSAEIDSGTDDTADKGEKTKSRDEWLDDSLKAEVAAYGIDEKELADFTSREELERALRFFDRSAMEAGRKAMAEGEQTNARKDRDKQGRFTKKEPEREPEQGKPEYEITLSKDVYDEELIGEFTRLRDHYESRVAALEARFSEADAAAEEQRFDVVVDSLGHADLFGKSGKENAKELQRRQDLFVAVKAQQIGLRQLGRDVDLDESLVNRVARMVFAEELGKKDLKERTRKISKQSDGIMGDSASKSPGPKETLRDEFRRRYKELESAG